VLVVGAGVARDEAWDEAIALAERHETPVWCAPMAGRNGFPEDHRLFAGFLAADRTRIVAALAGHDLVLVLGAPAFTYHVAGSGPHVPEGAELVQLTDDPAQAAWTPRGRAVVTDVRLGLRALLDGPAPARRASFVRPAPRDPPDASRLTESLLVHRIARLRPPGCVIVEEAPGTRGAMHDYLPIVERDGFHTCASGGLGHGLPAAVGVALARPDAKVIALLGDGSSLYSIQTLWTAAQLGLRIVFVIVDNRSYQALHQFAERFGLQTLQGTELPGLDFCALAQAQGIAARRVADVAGLDAALADAFTFARAVLLDVRVTGA
jgi:benzoylformate decarboxylase